MIEFVIPPSLAAKLGSIVVHVEEMFGPDGHHLDQEALKCLIALDDVQEFLTILRRDALLPVKRG